MQKRAVVPIRFHGGTKMRIARPTASTGAALGEPRQDHTLPFGHPRDTYADCFDNPCRLVTKNGRKGDSFPGSQNVKIARAKAAGRNPNAHLARKRVPHPDLFDTEWLFAAECDRSANC